MKKIRSNSKWSNLSPEQLATLESWLLDGQLTLDDVFARAKKELGFEGSRSSLHRFSQSCARTRSLRDLAETAAQIAAIEVPAGTEGTLFHSGLKLLAQRFLNRVMADATTDIPGMAALLLQSEANEIRRQEFELRQQSHKLRRERLELDRERWELERTGRGLEIATALVRAKPNHTDQFVCFYDYRRVNLRNRALYGKLPPEDVAPETEEEDEAKEAFLDKKEADWERKHTKQPKQSGEAPTGEVAAPPPAEARENAATAVAAIPGTVPGNPITKGPESRDIPLSGQV